MTQETESPFRVGDREELLKECRGTAAVAAWHIRRYETLMQGFRAYANNLLGPKSTRRFAERLHDVINDVERSANHRMDDPPAAEHDFMVVSRAALREELLKTMRGVLGLIYASTKELERDADAIIFRLEGKGGAR